MNTPFNPARLRELWDRDGWRIDQIVTLARDRTGLDVTESDVRQWLADAGIPQITPAAAETPKRGRPVTALVTRTCAECGKPVTRRAHRFNRNALCSPACSALYSARQGREKREARKQAGSQPASGEKTCADCGAVKPLGEFSVHVRRADGRNRICLVCSRARSAEWYQRKKQEKETASCHAA